MNGEVEKLKENALLHISTWWGLKYPGYSGTIITTDKELYEYFFYNDLVPAEFKGQKVNYITKKKDLTDREFKKIKKFIEKEIISKDYPIGRMRDVAYDVEVNYNGINKLVVNNKDDENHDGLYDKTEKLINKLINKKHKFFG